MVALEGAVEVKVIVWEPWTVTGEVVAE